MIVWMNILCLPFMWHLYICVFYIVTFYAIGILFIQLQYVKLLIDFVAVIVTI